MRTIKKGATSQSLYFVALDSASTTGGRKTGIVFNSAGLTAYYTRNQNVATAITLVTLAAANTAWASGGFKEVDATNAPGLYRIDVPDAAFASGVDSVAVSIKGAAGMVQADVEVQLVAIDLQDAVRAGLTALPNAAAEAAGGLFTRGTGAGQINQPANGMIDANVVRNAGTAIVSAAGRQEVNVTHYGGSAGTFTSGKPDVQNVAGNVTGSVGSVVGNVGGNVNGNVVGSVASVTGAVGSVTGAVGSVTGNVGGFLGGNVNGNVNGNLVGDVQGNLINNVLGGVAGSVGAVVAPVTLTVAERASIADKILGRRVNGAADGTRTVAQALAALRNKVEIVAGVLTVYDIDDVTPLYTAVVVTTAGNPISSIDP